MNPNINIDPNMSPSATPNVNNNPGMVPNQGAQAMMPTGQMPGGNQAMMQAQNMPMQQMNNFVNNPGVPNNQVNVASPQDKIKVFMKGLFNFANITKFIKYEKSSLIESTMPKDTKAIIDKPSYDNIMYGGILKILADLMSILFAVGMVYVIDTFDPAKIDGLRTLGLKNDVGLTAIIPVAITIIIFTYNCAIGYQQQKTTFHFAFIWMIFLSTIFSLINLVSYIAALFIAPLYGLLGLVSFLLALLGNINVVVGCIDFCQRVTKEYIDAHTVAPVQGPITMTRIDVDDVSDHNHKTCPNCGNQISSALTSCNICGSNL